MYRIPLQDGNRIQHLQNSVLDQWQAALSFVWDFSAVNILPSRSIVVFLPFDHNKFVVIYACTPNLHKETMVKIIQEKNNL